MLTETETETDTETLTLTLTSDSPNTVILDDEAREIAYQVAGAGSYRQSLIDGDARWSGADIKGSATRWAGRYKENRTLLLADLRRAGLMVGEVRGPHGRRIVIIGRDPGVDLAVTSGAAAVEIKFRAPLEGRI